MEDQEPTGVTVGPLQGSQRLIWFGGSIAGTQQERLHLPSPPYSPTDARVGEIVLTVQLLLNGWEEREFRGPTKRAEAARFAQRYYGEWLQDGRARQLATPPPSIRARKALHDESCPRDVALVQALLNAGYALSQRGLLAEGLARCSLQTSDNGIVAEILILDPTCTIRAIHHYAVEEPAFSASLIDAGILSSGEDHVTCRAFLITPWDGKEEETVIISEREHPGAAHLVALRWLAQHLHVNAPQDAGLQERPGP